MSRIKSVKKTKKGIAIKFDHRDDFWDEKAVGWRKPFGKLSDKQRQTKLDANVGWLITCVYRLVKGAEKENKSLDLQNALVYMEDMIYKSLGIP